MLNSNLIFERMKEKEIKQEYLADKLKVSQSTLSLKLNNKRALTISEMFSISEILDISPTEYKNFLMQLLQNATKKEVDMLSNVVLTTKQLAERWECKNQQIYERVDNGTLKTIKHLPKHRFSVAYIEEIERADCDPLSPMERRRLEMRIVTLEKQLEEKDKVIKGMVNLAKTAV